MTAKTKNIILVLMLTTAITFVTAGRAFSALPDRVTDLTAEAASEAMYSPSEGKIKLTWTAPAADGTTIAGYYIAYRKNSIDLGWTGKSELWFNSGATTKVFYSTYTVPGTPQVFIVSGLDADTTYYFAIKSLDSDLPTPLSSLIDERAWEDDFTVDVATENIVEQAYATTPGDLTRPTQILDLTALPHPTIEGAIKLVWTAPAEQTSTWGNQPASKYYVSYNSLFDTDHYFDEDNWWIAGPTEEYLDVPLPIAAGTVQSITITSLIAGNTYYFAIKSEDEVPWVSNIDLKAEQGEPPQAQATAQIDVTSPAQITNLTAIQGNLNQVIDLSWTAPGDDGTNNVITNGLYYIQCSTYSGVAWDWDPVSNNEIFKHVIIATNTIPNETHMISISELTIGVTFYFKIRTADEVDALKPMSANLDRRNWSDVSNVPWEVAPADVQEPSAITDLTAVTGDSEGQVKLSWTAPDEDGIVGGVSIISEYIVKYNQEDVHFYGDFPSDWWNNSFLVTTSTGPMSPGSIQSLVVTGLTPDVTYYFAIKSIDEVPQTSLIDTKAGINPWSIANAKAQTDVTPPDGITELTALTGTNEGEIDLIWTSTGDDFGDGTIANGAFRIQHSTDVGFSAWSPTDYDVEITSGTIGEKIEFSCTVTGLRKPDYETGQTFYFRMWVRDEVGNNWSALSVGATAMAQVDVDPPAAITVLSALPGNDEGEIELSWTAPGDDGTNNILNSGSEFRIQYSTWVGVVWSTNSYSVKIPTESVNSGDKQYHTITGLAGGDKYYFRIWTKDETAANWSVQSSTVSAVVMVDMIVPDQISTLNADQSGLIEGQILLSWNATGDDGPVGDINGGNYHIKYSTNSDVVWSTSALTGYNIQFATNTIASSYQERLITGLGEPDGFEPGATFYFRIWLKDESAVNDNWSTVSNSATTWAQPDVSEPNRITNLSADLNGCIEGQLRLSWTAPDEDKGTEKGRMVDIYIVRYSTGIFQTPATDYWNMNWSWVKTITTLNVAAPGSDVSYVMEALIPDAEYYFSIKSADERNLTSLINKITGNQVKVFAQHDITDPSSITDLSASTGPGEGEITLTWTAPGDDGTTGTVASYIVKYSPAEITDGNWAAATVFNNNWTPQKYLTLEINNVTELTNDATFYFAIRAVDDRGNISPNVSNSPLAKTLDTEPPSSVNTFLAYRGVSSVEGEINLSWLAPGDNGNTGTIEAGEYRIQYASYSVVWSTNNYIVSIATADVSFGDLQYHKVAGLVPAATYYFRIWTRDEVLSNWSGISIGATNWVQIDVTEPGRITGINALQGEEEGEIDLFWTAPGDDNYINVISSGTFGIKYSTSPSYDWESAGYDLLIDTNNVSPGDIQFNTFTGLIEGATYYFRVWTADELNNWSQISAGATNWAQVDFTAPSAVTTLVAFTWLNEGEIKLSWSAPGDDGIIGTIEEGEYRIQYSSDSSFTAWDLNNYDESISTDAVSFGDPQSFVVTGLQEPDYRSGTTFYFRLWSTDKRLNWSDISDGATTWAQVDVMPPSAVTDLSADPGVDEGMIDLAWTAPGDNGTSGDIINGYYGIKWSSFPAVDWNGPSGFNYLWNATSTVKSLQNIAVSGLTGGVTYYFRLWAADEVQGWSGISDGATIWAQVDVEAPAAITTLYAVTGLVEGEVNLSWIATGDDGYANILTSGTYYIAHSKNPGQLWQFETDYVAVSTQNVMPGSTRYYKVTGLDPGVTYYFNVWLFDDLYNKSGYSNNATSYAQLDLAPPVKITNLQADVSGCIEGQVHLYWTAPDEDKDVKKGRSVTSYTIKYATKTFNDSLWNASWVREVISTVTSLPGNIDETLIDGLTGGDTYWFAVKSVDEVSNESEISDVISGLAQIDVTDPSAIIDLSAVQLVQAGEIELTWTAPGDDDTTGTVSYYAVRSATFAITNDSTWQLADVFGNNWAPQVSGTIQSFTVTGLADDVVYYFSVRGVDDLGNTGAVSNNPNAKTKDIEAPSQVTGLYATQGTGQGDIQLVWSAPGDNDTTGSIISGQYAIQYSSHMPTNEIVWSTTSANGIVFLPMTSVDYGVGQNIVISGLEIQTSYYFRLWTSDEESNWSSISNGATSWAQADLIAPDTITNLAAVPGSVEGQVVLSWTATGDDGDVGTADAYEIKYTSYQIIADTATWWNAAMNVTENVPNVSGTPESLIIAGLKSGITYYFDLRVRDEAFNWTELSGKATAWAQYDLTPPATAYNLVATARGTDEGAVDMAWTAPGDDGTIGSITGGSVWVQYTTTPGAPAWDKDNFNFVDAAYNAVQGSGSNQAIVDLWEGNTYYFKIWIADEAGNYISAGSNISQVYLSNVDPTPPLTVIAEDNGNTTVAVSWNKLSPYDYKGYHIYKSPVSFSNTYSTCTVGLWHLDEGSGTAVYDWSEYGHDGTLQNSGAWIAGKFGQAVNSSYIVIPDSADLNPSQAMVIEAWVKPNVVNIQQAIMASDYSWMFGIDTNGKLRFHQYISYGSAISTEYSASTLAPGVWQHVVVEIKSGSYLKFYIDGVMDVERSGYTLTPAWWHPGEVGGTIKIGRGQGSWATINGSIDQVRMSNGVRNSYLVGTYYNDNTLSWTDTNVLEGNEYWYAAATFDRTANEGDSVTSVSVNVDATAPGPVVALNAVSGYSEGDIDLSWTAPGDDWYSGTAQLYTIQYATFGISGAGLPSSAEAWWSLTGPDIKRVTVSPQIAGSAESLIIAGLSPGITYWFAIKTEDEVPLTSSIDSKSIGGTQAFAKAQIDLVPPAKNIDIGTPDISAVNWAEGEIKLEWQAPGDDGVTKDNTAGLYVVRYSTVTLVSLAGDVTAWWNQAIDVPGEPSPGTLPTLESLVISGLVSDTMYYFGLRTADEYVADKPGPDGRNWSDISEIVNVMTRDYTAPSPPTQLTSISGNFNVKLNWTAPTTDENGGSISIDGYRIYRSSISGFFVSAPDPSIVPPVTPITMLAAGTTYFIDVPPLDDKYYYYVVTAVDEPNTQPPGNSNDSNYTGRNESDPSNEIPGMKKADNTPPGAITTLSALTGASEGEIDLSWIAPGDDGSLLDITSGGMFGIKWSTIAANDWNGPSGFNLEISTSPIEVGSIYNTQLGNADGLMGGTTYYFRIWTKDDVGNWSAVSNGATAMAQVDVMPPAAVTSLAGATGQTEGMIELSWTSTGDDGYDGTIINGAYRVQYSSNPLELWWNSTVPGDWPPAEGFDQRPIPSISSGTLQTWNIEGLIGGTSYYVRLWTMDESNNWSAISNGATAWSQIDITPPAAIDDFTGDPGEHEGEVDLAWSAPGDDGSSSSNGIYTGLYGIKWSSYPVAESYWGDPNDGNFNFSFIQSINVNAPESITRNGFTGGVTYYFRIWTGDEEDPPSKPVRNWSAISNGVTTWAQVDVMAPGTITTLSALTGANEGQIDLSWIAPGDDGTTNDITGGSYGIKYSTDPSHDWGNPENFDEPWAKTIYAGQAEQYTLNSLVPGATYYLRVWTSDESGNWSGISNGATAMAQVDVMAPAAITDLAAFTGESEGKLKLTWTAPGDDGTTGFLSGKYGIKFTTETFVFWPTKPPQGYTFDIELPVTTNPGTSEELILVGLNPGATYFITIWTEDDNGNWSDLSNTATGVVQIDIEPPSAITNLSALTGANEGEIELSWTAPGDDGTSGDIVGGFYRIKWSTSASYPWDHNVYNREISTSVTPGDEQRYLVNQLDGGVTYYFRIWTADELLNWSEISNGATAQAQVDVMAPNTITTLAGDSGNNEGEIVLSWIAPGDDGTRNDMLDEAGTYGIKISSDPGRVWNGPSGFNLQWTTNTYFGRPESRLFEGLNAGVTYYFRIWTADEKDNWSEISNGATVWAQIDLVPPGIITTLSALTGAEEGQINLTWTAPGDNGIYDPLEDTSRFGIKFSSNPNYNWGGPSGFSIGEMPAQSFVGELFTLIPVAYSFAPGATYYFRIWTRDDSGNWSAISAGATAMAQVDVMPPAAITNLSALTGSDEGQIDLSWTAPGDDGTVNNQWTGMYRLKYTEDSSHEWEFSDLYNPTLSKYDVDETELRYGENRAITLSGLTGGTTYYFRMWTRDDRENWSWISNSATSWAMVDNMAPGVITTLSATSLTSLLGDSIEEGETYLTWTAPGDDGYIKQLVSGSQYLIQLSTYYGVAWSTSTQRVQYVDMYDWNPYSQINSNWIRGGYVVTVPTAAVQPGDHQGLMIKGLEEGSTFYFRIWTEDENGNLSELSNTATSQAMVDFVPPASIQLTALRGTIIENITLKWTAPGDNLTEVWNYEGKYDIRYATYQFSAAEWDSPWLVKVSTTILPDPIDYPLNDIMRATITGLKSDTWYWFALKTADDSKPYKTGPENRNWSVLRDIDIVKVKTEIMPPQQVIGFTSTLSGDGKSTTLEWNPVIINENGTVCEDLFGYNIWRCKESIDGAFELMGSSSTPTTVSKSFTTWTEPDDISGTVYYYKVVAIDESLNPGRDSMIIDTSVDENIIVLAGDGDYTRLVIPKYVSEVLYAETNDYGEDLKVRVVVDTESITGDVIKSYNFVALTDSDTRVSEFSFRKARPQVIFTYKESDVASGLFSASAADLSEQYALSMFWHNGKRWLRVGGEANEDSKTITVKAKRLGKYMIKMASEVTSLTVTSVTPSIMTPNGDHLNDWLYVLFDYPDGTNQLSIVAKIYDVNGAEVSGMTLGPTQDPDKYTSAKWDGKDESGFTVEAGIYIYQIEVSNQVKSGAFVVAK